MTESNYGNIECRITIVLLGLWVTAVYILRVGLCFLGALFKWFVPGLGVMHGGPAD